MIWSTAIDGAVPAHNMRIEGDNIIIDNKMDSEYKYAILTDELNADDSVDDAVKAIGVHDSRNILAVCRGDRKTAYGRRWRYADGFCDKGERKE